MGGGDDEVESELYAVKDISQTHLPSTRKLLSHQQGLRLVEQQLPGQLGVGERWSDRDE